MKLDNIKYIDDFRELPYPKHKMLIVGSSVMALLGIRENNDIDIWVGDEIFEEVSYDRDYIHKVSRTDGFPVYERKDGRIEFMKTLPPLEDRLEDHLRRAMVVDGIYFQNVKDILRWKKLIEREKDINDIELLEEYMERELMKERMKYIKNAVNDWDKKIITGEEGIRRVKFIMEHFKE